jgi:lipid II:glycine glycyltransferase (peptidoglycan interpeptide bridge formation enzyme)
MYEFEQIDLCNIDLNEFNNFENKSIFTTVEWLEFVEEDSKANPIILKISKEKKFIGYFSALTVTKFGVKIIASPFNGWSTCFMGFDTHVDNKIEIIHDLSEHLFKFFKCSYIEIIDRDISIMQAQAIGYSYTLVSTLELAIDKSDEELFKVFKTDCRNFIRQFERRGAVLETAIPNDEFAEEYYEQLKDVFAKQSLVPTYSVEKVKRLLNHLSNTGMLLCLRVCDPEGLSIATSIFIGYNKKFFFWGGASLRQYQSYRPNEYMIWYAIKYWRERGCEIFDMVGVRDYKKKFGSLEKQYAKIIVPKYNILISLRDFAQKYYFTMLKVKGYMLRKK